jgi:hypothetical protein
MKATVVSIRFNEIGGTAYRHGDEIPPGAALSPEEMGKLIDQGRLIAYPERRSLYKLFSAFSGCSEHEELDKDEASALCLPP